MNIHPLRPRDHEDAARVAISWLAERHRKGWRSAFEALLDFWRPEGQRDRIAQLCARPLRLYRVTDVQPGAGMTLIDEFDPQAQPQPVHEISGSRSARPDMLIGAGIMGRHRRGHRRAP